MEVRVGGEEPGVKLGVVGVDPSQKPLVIGLRVGEVFPEAVLSLGDGEEATGGDRLGGVLGVEAVVGVHKDRELFLGRTLQQVGANLRQFRVLKLHLRQLLRIHTVEKKHHVVGFTLALAAQRDIAGLAVGQSLEQRSGMAITLVALAAAGQVLVEAPLHLKQAVKVDADALLGGSGHSVEEFVRTFAVETEAILASDPVLQSVGEADLFRRSRGEARAQVLLPGGNAQLHSVERFLWLRLTRGEGRREPWAMGPLRRMGGDVHELASLLSCSKFAQ